MNCPCSSRQHLPLSTRSNLLLATQGHWSSNLSSLLYHDYFFVFTGYFALIHKHACYFSLLKNMYVCKLPIFLSSIVPFLCFPSQQNSAKEQAIIFYSKPSPSARILTAISLNLLFLMSLVSSFLLLPVDSFHSHLI